MTQFSTPHPTIDLDFLRGCLIEAGQMALERRNQVTVEIKADHTPVTEVDRQVERFLIGRIAERYPDQPVLSEESGLHAGGADTIWVIDPIDGTRSYASGLPVWGVSIGVLRDGRPLAGGLYLPLTREMYWGTAEKAYYNDQPLPRLEPPNLQDVLVFLAVPSNFHLHFDSSYPRVRSMGSTAAHLAYVATGAAAGALLRRASLWDIAGLLPVLAAVGAEIAEFDGRSFDPAQLLNGRPLHAPVLVAHPQVMAALRAQIHPR